MTQSSQETLARLARLAVLVTRRGSLALRAAREGLVASRGGMDAARAVTLTRAVSLAESAGPAPASPVERRGLSGSALRFLDLDAHGAALVLSHVALGLPPATSATVLGLHERSLAVNLSSVLGRLRDPKDPTPAGCRGPGETAVRWRALRISSPEETEQADRHLAEPCQDCADMSEALGAELDALAEELAPLLEPDPDAETLLAGDATLADAPAGVPFNPARVLGVSKQSCLAVGMALGLLAAVTLVVGVELFWGDPWFLLAFFGASGEPSAPEGSPPAPEARDVLPPRIVSMDPGEALRDLASPDTEQAGKARRFLTEFARRNLDAILEARRSSPDRAALLDEILVAGAVGETRKRALTERRALSRIQARAAGLAASEFAALTLRRSLLERERSRVGALLGEARSAGAPADWVANLEDQDLALRVRLSRLDGADRASLTSEVEIALRAETRARLERYRTWELLMTPVAAAAHLGDDRPRFSLSQAFALQKDLVVPALTRAPVPPEQVLVFLSAWVDFAVVILPGTLRDDDPRRVDLPDPMGASEAVERVASALGLQAAPFDGGLLLAPPGPPPSRDILSLLAGSLAAPSLREEGAAARAFDALTVPEFGYDPAQAPDWAVNRHAADRMIQWYEANHGSIARDAETGLYDVERD